MTSPSAKTVSTLAPNLTRRGFCRGLLAAGAACFTGCGGDPNQFGRLDKVWGRRGIIPGRLQKPRAMAIDAADRLYIVDFLARIHVFDADGEFIKAWRTPNFDNGKPTGITVDGDRLLVADTHYYRILPYTLDGELIEEDILGGVNGQGPGEFGLVTDAMRDSTGALYVPEYGGYDRIQKFSPDGEYVLEWGQYGQEPGQFNRPQNILVDNQDRIWVCDACNHRIQVFDTQGELLFLWGELGAEPGQLSYPYDIAMDEAGVIYLCEFGNHRVQRLTQAGEPLGSWGRQGRGPGELYNPWSLVLDSRGRMHVLDTYNHRVQRVVI